MRWEILKDAAQRICFTVSYVMALRPFYNCLWACLPLRWILRAYMESYWLSLSPGSNLLLETVSTPEMFVERLATEWLGEVSPLFPRASPIQRNRIWRSCTTTPMSTHCTPSAGRAVGMPLGAWGVDSIRALLLWMLCSSLSQCPDTRANKKSASVALLRRESFSLLCLNCWNWLIRRILKILTL